MSDSDSAHSLCDGGAFENDVTFSEQGVEEIIGHAREVRKVTSFPEAEINFLRS